MEHWWVCPVVALAIASVAAFPSSGAGQAHAPADEDFGKNVVHTDGHLRPDHMETIWVKGFPGRGRTEVGFFPTAICEEECQGLGGNGGTTDENGRGRFRVRVPNGFINSHRKFTPFRNRERIDLNVLWYGPNDDEFDIGVAEPPPVIVRIHKPKHWTVQPAFGRTVPVRHCSRS